MAGGAVREYGHGSYDRSMDSYTMDSGSDRFGPYESYDSRSSVGGRDLYRSGYGYNESDQGYGDSYDGRYDNPYRSSVDSYDGRNQGGSNWDPSFPRAKVRTGFMEDRGRDNYSSYGGFSSPYMKPAAVGSRGRGMPAYHDSAFGGPAAGRGRGRGGFGRGMRRPGIMDYNPQPMSGGMARGIKRKMVQPFKAPVGFGKKPKLAKAGANQNAKPAPAPEPVDPEEEEKRRTEARREKQRRRREKNSEKYGDGMAFTCSFCKFRSFEEKGIEDHLVSEAHQEMLDHIQKQTKFDKPVMEFLHECIVNKYKKTAARKAQATQNQNEAAKAPEKDIMEGVTPDDHMMKVETVHCSACSVYVPALHSSVQLHLKSSDHSKSKLAYKDQIKRESILTATSILNNPLVKARYELYLKGENPFETHPEEAAQETVTEDAEASTGAEGEVANAVEADVEEAESEDFTADPLTTTDEN
ncbi:PREDICTED: DBIRD complex subunit ZNF326 isoform X3 [Nanorana parkeri]|uniref:DBIRD complex subunit ZNF326 isoform X3 n=1 Tax=Nanorana parkeri TaxID=125878 RepID=UPI000854CB5A|nr:PREDICTED: DBIRD complex subunit ZNF326 isoform X3 [Nanorana parkeri]